MNGEKLTIIIDGDCSNPESAKSFYRYHIKRDNGAVFENSQIDWKGYDGGLSLNVLTDLLRFLDFDIFTVITK